MCGFCNVKVYFKIEKIMKSILAPLTKEEELIQQVEDTTGYRYIEIPKKYCPICGRKVEEE